MYRKITEEVLVNKKLFLLCLAVVLTLAIGTAVVSAEPEAQWNGYYCTSGNCGVNYYNYNYGFNTGYYCSNPYQAPFRAEFIRDVNYPDGTYVAPGTTFTKTWRIRNTGTQAWTTDMRLVYVGGDPANAVSAKIPYYVAPGNNVDISIRLTAPAYGGSVTGQWMIQAPDGTLFGVGCNGQTPIWVAVNTWTNGACGCLGQAVCACQNANVTRSGRNPYCNNKIRSITDVTYPDGTVVAPGATFRKTRKMKNGGTCVWNENYTVNFFYGDDLGFNGTAEIVRAYDDGKVSNGTKYQINRPPKVNIYPDDYILVSIDLKAPTTPGVYESYYKLRDNLGYEFGFGSYADSAFWVNIVVSDEGAKSVEEAEVITKDVEEAAVETPAEAAPAPEVLPVTVMGDTVANKCGEQSIAMRNTDAGYQVLWTAVNAGTATWDNYTLVKSDSNPAVSLANNTVAVPLTAPGETAEVSFDINLDSTVVTEDPLWMEFYMNSGDEGFCQFYFEAPAK